MSLTTNIITLPQIPSDIPRSNHETDIIKHLMHLKGQFCSITYRRPLKLLKEYVNKGMVGEKLTSMMVRAGVDYTHIQNVIEKNESGELKSDGLLRGRKWIFFPYILQSEKTGKLLFRFYTVKGKRANSRYFIDGNEVAEEVLPTYCLSSEYREREGTLDCFDLPIETILNVK